MNYICSNRTCIDRQSVLSLYPVTHIYHSQTESHTRERESAASQTRQAPHSPAFRSQTSLAMAAAAAQAGDAQAALPPAQTGGLLLAPRQTEQGIPDAQIQAAEAAIQAATDSLQVLEIQASLQYRLLTKVRQLEKQLHFMEARQDAQCSLPAEARQTVPDAAREADRVAATQGQRERDRESGGKEERESGAERLA